MLIYRPVTNLNFQYSVKPILDSGTYDECIQASFYTHRTLCRSLLTASASMCYRAVCMHSDACGTCMHKLKHVHITCTYEFVCVTSAHPRVLHILIRLLQVAHTVPAQSTLPAIRTLTRLHASCLHLCVMLNYVTCCMPYAQSDMQF